MATASFLYYMHVRWLIAKFFFRCDFFLFAISFSTPANKFKVLFFEIIVPITNLVVRYSGFCVFYFVAPYKLATFEWKKVLQYRQFMHAEIRQSCVCVCVCIKCICIMHLYTYTHTHWYTVKLWIVKTKAYDTYKNSPQSDLQ